MSVPNSVDRSGFYLFTSKTNDLYADLASAIPFYPSKKNRSEFFKYVSENCLNRYVRIKGQIQTTDKKRSTYGYLLITDGIWDLSLKGEPGCHFNFLSELKAKNLGFEQ
ncbi:MAG: hypothetical protein COB38_10220 [Gammaproteobacteria bacterium]|nr:MAG: hypothetical protein COB38_10220 [Gammaproteobacteria bacterium]